MPALLTREERDRIGALLREGLTVTEVVERSGRDRRTVERVRSALAIPKRRGAIGRRPLDLPMDDVARRHAEGEPLREIAAELGVTSDTLRRRLGLAPARMVSGRPRGWRHPTPCPGSERGS